MIQKLEEEQEKEEEQEEEQQKHHERGWRSSCPGEVVNAGLPLSCKTMKHTPLLMHYAYWTYSSAQSKLHNIFDNIYTVYIWYM